MPMKRSTEQDEILKSLGLRLKSARELSNLTLEEVAHVFGCQNTRWIKRLEHGIGTMPRAWFIPQAAQLYEVSLDYLFGFTDEPCRCQPIYGQIILNQMEHFGDEVPVGVVSRMDSWLTAIEKSVITGYDRARETQNIFFRFAQLNEEFLGMKLSGRMLDYAQEFVNESKIIAKELAR